MHQPPESGDLSASGRVIARAASFLLLFGAALAAQVPARFALGDSRERVRQVQGNPEIIERLTSQGLEHWRWDAALVTFDAATGRVIEWNDPRGTLRVALRAQRRSSAAALTLGAGLGEVARLLGTPWAVTRDASRKQMYLAYSRSVVRVDIGTGTVSGWIRRDATLPLAASDDSVAHAALSARPMALSPLAGPSHVAGAPAPVALSLAGVLVADANADQRLARREFADITIRIRNDGPESTPPLPAHLLRTPGLVFIAGAPDTIWLPPIAPRDTIEVVVTAYATGDVASPELVFVVWSGRALLRLSSRIPTTSVVKPPPSGDSSRPLAPNAEPLAPPALAPNPDAVAVIVGIERYRRLPEARFAERDATLMRTFAVRTLGVPDDAAHLAFRIGADASGSELRRLLGAKGWLARRASDNADILVYFAGHGASDGQPHLLPHDADASYVSATGLDLHALFDHLARLPARSITVILDACFSGLGRTGRPLVPGTRAAVVSIEHPALLRRNMAVFVASRDAELAGDLPDARHGAFTYFVARGLGGDADRDGDRVITVDELGRYVSAQVTRATAALDREQHPLTIARDTLRPVARLAPRP